MADTRKSVTAYITSAEHERLKEFSFLERRSISKLVQDGLTKILKERKRNGQQRKGDSHKKRRAHAGG